MVIESGESGLNKISGGQVCTEEQVCPEMFLGGLLEVGAEGARDPPERLVQNQRVSHSRGHSQQTPWIEEGAEASGHLRLPHTIPGALPPTSQWLQSLSSFRCNLLSVYNSKNH